MQKWEGLIPFGFLLALGLVVSTYLAADAVRDVRMSHQIIKVRGYAEIPVTSDLAIWEVGVKTRNPALSAAYVSLAAHRQKVLTFLKENGIGDDEITVQHVSVSEIYKKTAEGEVTNEIECYQLSQEIEVKTKNVEKLTAVTTAISNLLGEGIELHVRPPRYYFTGVNELKEKLLVQATRDARERAITLAEGSGVRLGPLRAARQGPFSIVAADASSISDEEGYEDFVSIKKKVTAVVTVDYAMK